MENTKQTFKLFINTYSAVFAFMLLFSLTSNNVLAFSTGYESSVDSLAITIQDIILKGKKYKKTILEEVVELEGKVKPNSDSYHKIEFIKACYLFEDFKFNEAHEKFKETLVFFEESENEEMIIFNRFYILWHYKIFRKNDEFYELYENLNKVIEGLEEYQYLQLQMLDFYAYMEKANGNIEKSKEINIEILNELEKEEVLPYLYIKTIIYLGEKERLEGNIDKAIEIYNKGVSFIETKEEEANKLNPEFQEYIYDKAEVPLKINLANAYKEKKEFAKALETLNNLLEMTERKKIPFSQIIYIKLTIAKIYSEVGDYDKAIYNYGEIMKEKDSPDYEASFTIQILYDIARTYRKKGAYKIAMEKVELGLEECEKTTVLLYEVKLKVLKGELSFLLGENRDAISILSPLVTEENESVTKSMKSKIFQVLGNVYLAEKSYDKSIEYGLLSLSYETEEYQITENNYWILYKSYKQQGNEKKALNYLELYNNAIQADFKEKALMDFARYQLKNKLFKDSIDIKDLKLENQIEVSKNIVSKQAIKNRNLQIIIAAFLALIFLGSTMFFRLNNAKSKKLAETNEKLAKQSETILEQEQSYRLSRDNLFANLSHEFRTPLTVLQTSLQDVQDSKTKMFRSNVEHLIDLTNQMLDLSKLSEDKMVLTPEHLDVNQFLLDLLQQLESFAAAKKMNLNLHIPKIFPYPLMDRTALRKIVMNLVFNALKFTENEGQVDVMIKYDVDKWSISVKDNGAGISEKYLPHVFDRYYRGVLNTDRRTTGGLGLALTKELVEFCKGEVSVESQVGIGSTFVVSFPNEEKWLPEKPVDYTLYEITNKNLLLNQFKVTERETTNVELPEDAPSLLLVEDNLDLNDIIFKSLSNHYHIYRAYNGLEALEKIELKMPDLILTDIMMPQMNGVELVRNLKKRSGTKNIPIIVMSALGEKFQNMELWKLGAVDFVTKPFDLEVLLYKIKNIVYPMKEVADEKEKMKMMSSMLVHDLKAPVRMMKSYSQLLLRPNSEKLREEFLGYIVKGAENMNELINALSEISKISNRKNYEPIKLDRVLDLTLFNLSELINQKKAIIGKDIQVQEIIMNKIDLMQILQNLIQNALTYSRKDVVPEVKISAEPIEEGGILLKIADNGRGIKKEEQLVVFEQFRRGSSSTGTDGTGLGMYIISEIVKKYNGRISLESELGIGTTFFIELAQE